MSYLKYESNTYKYLLPFSTEYSRRRSNNVKYGYDLQKYIVGASAILQVYNLFICLVYIIHHVVQTRKFVNVFHK